MKQLLKTYILSRVSIYMISLISSLLVRHGEKAAEHYKTLFPETSDFAFRMLKPLIFYDGDFFLEISLHGYQYDKSMAFFPGFPVLTNVVGSIAHKLLPFLSKFTAFVITGYTINIIAAYLAVLVVCKMIGILDSKSAGFNSLTAIVMILNPNSIYFCSLYSEPLFLLIQALGLLYISKCIKRGSFAFTESLFATLIFAVGSFVRSNGFVSVGFVLYFYFIYNFSIRKIVKVALSIPLFTILAVFPFILVQLAQKQLICANDYTPSCNNKLSLVYGGLQKKYWDVEFMSFIEGRRLVNLGYMIPILIALYFAFKTLIFRGKFAKKMFNVFKLEKVTDLEDFMVPSVYLLLILLFIGLTTMHFNSFNRLLSGYPFYYIFIAQLHTNLGRFGRRCLEFWLVAFQIPVIVFAVNNYITM